MLFFSNKYRMLWFFAVLILFLINCILICFYTPMIPDQHWAQKIFYFHVPSAWIAFLSYFIVMITAILFLYTNHKHWDNVSLAAAEIGTLFTAIVLITGPIWAHPVWGKAWSWEPRLTTTLILFLIYIGYFMIRSFGGNPEKVSRVASVLGIIAFVDVPIIYFAVDMWSSEFQSHPPRTVVAESSSDIQLYFLYSFFTFICLYVLMLNYRTHVIKLSEKYQRYDI
ncbi:MAG: cytochrome C assembly protein [Candidatus Marinimicrobia bacterium]|nr:cytochrome C assembly protein [Candidatus Neomarinimicrobiota bacterium]